MDKLLAAICNFQAENVFNPWRDVDPLDAHVFAHYARRKRLREHFQCEPRFVLVGEAPGYQGCHFSGVPFTNEALLLKGAIPRVNGYGRITTRPRPWSEPSATIVWRTLHELGIADQTVLWNAFAWHPHKPGIPMSNRAPTRLELADGCHVLEAVCRHFHQVPIVAVGSVAAAALEYLGITVAAAVRHPSMGGSREFRAGLRTLTR